MYNFRTGHGVYTFANGDKYEGDFVDNRRHGQGKMIYRNGTVKEGRFVNDNFKPVPNAKAAIEEERKGGEEEEKKDYRHTNQDDGY